MKGEAFPGLETLEGVRQVPSRVRSTPKGRALDGFCRTTMLHPGRGMRGSGQDVYTRFTYP